MRSYLRGLLQFGGSQAQEERRATWIFAEDVPSAATHAECRKLAELAVGGTVLELGSFYGRSTIALASTGLVVHSVDPHDGGTVPNAPRTLGKFLDNLERYGVRAKVDVHLTTSTELGGRFAAESFDLVFVDAMHHRPDIDIDLAIAVKLLRPGGAVAFHDYGRDGVEYEGTWYPFGVTEAVDDFVGLASLPVPEVVDYLAVISSPIPSDHEARRAVGGSARAVAHRWTLNKSRLDRLEGAPGASLVGWRGLPSGIGPAVEPESREAPGAPYGLGLLRRPFE